MSRKLLLALAAAALAGSSWPWWGGATAAAAGPASPHDLFTVRRGDLRITLVENGTLVAKESQKVTAKIRSESKVVWLIEEGTEVGPGDVVCRLEEAPLKRQLDEVQLELLQTEANLKTARTELEIQAVETAATVQKAKVALDKAGKEIEKYRDGEAPQARRKLEVALKDAETEFVRKRKNLEDSKKLLEQNYIKKSELEDHQIAFERATVQKESAEKDLELFDKYTFPMTVADLATKLADAQREIETAQKRGEATLGQKAVAVQQVEKRQQVQTEQVKERQEDLDNMTLKAPCPGIVVHGNPHEPWYRDRIKVGNQIHGGFTVVTVPDLRVMQVRLQIHEADISKLKAGLRATVTTESYPGLQLQGEVTRIATVANSNGDWSGQSEVKKFDVEVTLQTPDVQLRPGISAKVEIHVDVRPATLFVPLQSVFHEDDAHWCNVQEPGKPPVRRRVTIGSANDNYVEVADGVREGEQVLLYNPLLPEAGSAKPKEDGGAPPAAATPPAPPAKARS